MKAKVDSCIGGVFSVATNAGRYTYEPKSGAVFSHYKVRGYRRTVEIKHGSRIYRDVVAACLPGSPELSEA